MTSSTPPQEWANTTFVATPVVDHVRERKHRTGRDIGVHGSIELAWSLLRADLVDELQLVLAPNGAGGPISTT